MDGLELWLYVAACIVVPAAWGAFTALIFTRLDRRRAASAGGRERMDYRI